MSAEDKEKIEASKKAAEEYKIQSQAREKERVDKFLEAGGAHVCARLKLLLFDPLSSICLLFVHPRAEIFNTSIILKAITLGVVYTFLDYLGSIIPFRIDNILTS